MNIEELFSSDNYYQTKVGEYTFIWKLLSLKEFEKIEALLASGAFHPYIVYGMVFDYCYIGNKNTINNTIPAGITVSIGELIYSMSGGRGVDSLINDIAESRNNPKNSSLISFIEKTIYTAWNAYTPEDLKKFTYPELLAKFAQAEDLLAYRVPEYQRLDLNKILKDKNKPKNSGVNFAKENAELKANISDVHPLDMAPEDLDKISRRKGRRPLTKELARRLDKRR